MSQDLQTGLRTVLISAVVSALLCVLALGSYERWVRQPRTPRLAVVDVGSLFAQVQQAGRLAAIRNPGGMVGAAGADVGPRLQAALETTARRCACTLVAMPAVFGVSAGVPDLTAAVRELLGTGGAVPGLPPAADPSAH